MGKNDRAPELIKKVLDNLFEEQPTFEEAIFVWQTLGMFLFSQENELNRLDTVTQMLLLVKDMYKDVAIKNMNIN
jgi:hypothetical protein